MESAHLLGPGAKKRVKIHPHTVTAQYATQAPYSPQSGGVHTHFPQPGDEGYDDAPSFEDFGSFLDETSDRKKLTETRKWPQTLFGSIRDKEKEKGTPLRTLQGAGGGGGGGGAGGGVLGGGGGAGEGCSSAVGLKGPGKGVGGQLASFGEASVSASRWTWALVLAAALAHGGLVFLTRLASDRFGLVPLLLVLVRSAAQLPSVAVPLQRGENPFGPPGYRLRLLGYGLTHSLSLCCAAASLAFAAADEYAAPTCRLATTALSAALAFLLLEERLGLADGAALITGVCGLGLTLLPAADQPEAPGGGGDPVAFWRAAFGWSLSLMAGLWMALALVSYRSLKERVGLATALFTVSWTGCLLAPASMVLLHGGWAWPSPSLPGGVPVWGLMAALVAASVLGFLGTTHALTRLHPALVSASLSLEVPVAALLQLAVLPAVPFAPEVVGDVMVVLSVGCLVTVKLLPSHGTGGRRQREEYEEILDSPIK